MGCSSHIKTSRSLLRNTVLSVVLCFHLCSSVLAKGLKQGICVGLQEQ